MAAEKEPIEVVNDSDAAGFIRDAISTGPDLVVVDGSVCELEAHPASKEEHDLTLRGSFSNIAGIIGDGEPTDVARHLDEYPASACEPRS